MDNNLYIPDMYPVTFLKTVTLKVNNIEMHDDIPTGYSFDVKCDDGLIIKFDQSMSISSVFGSRIVLNASVGLARYRRMVYPDVVITESYGLLPPGNQLLESFIIDAYSELMAVLCKPYRHVNIVVKWPEKEE